MIDIEIPVEQKWMEIGEKNILLGVRRGKN